MKKTTLFSILLFLSFTFPLFSQSINTSELLRMREMSPPQKESFLIKKGFYFSSLEKGAKIFYFGGSNSSEPNAIMTIKDKFLIYSFKGLSRYQIFLDEIESFGFKYQDEVKNDRGTGYKYLKGNLYAMIFKTSQHQSFNNITLGTLDEILSLE